MDADLDLRAKRSVNPSRTSLEKTGLYHSFLLPNGKVAEGSMDLAWQQARLESFRLPADLSGKRVLDIGPWDGYYTFEMERRGARVTAIDVVDLDTFRSLHRAFHSSATYIQAELYDLDPTELGTFDIVLCLGVLYHLKHPFLAIEKLCALTGGVCIIDTFVIDGHKYLTGDKPELPYAEFYEGGELAGQLDNWCGPTVSAVEAWIRSAGFASAEVSRVTETSACILAHRKWNNLPPDDGPSVELLGLTNNLNRGRSFTSGREEYIVLWCNWRSDVAPSLASVFPQVDDFGVAPFDCPPNANGLHVSFRLPPGLGPGRHAARLKIGNSAWSNWEPFHLDLPDSDLLPTITAIQDGVSWVSGEVNWGNGGWMTIWADGLAPTSDAGNTVVQVSGIPHYPNDVFAAEGQINVRLRLVVEAGLHDVVVVHCGARSKAHKIRVLGNPPPVRGLESLSG